jgi:DNA-directed RNA polymerase subunit omega
MCSEFAFKRDHTLATDRELGKFQICFFAETQHLSSLPANTYIQPRLFSKGKSLLLIKRVKHLSYLARLTPRIILLNSELCKQALVKVGNPNVLVNLVSRRVRQLNSGGGAISRPLVGEIGNAGAADIALREIIEEKIGFEMPEELAVQPAITNRKRKKH